MYANRKTWLKSVVVYVFAIALSTGLVTGPNNAHARTSLAQLLAMINELTARVTTLEQQDPGYGQLPVGSIIMWSGDAEDIPDGWVICDGTNGTPNLLNRFVVGAGDEYALGDSGGGQLTLQLTNIPTHLHGFSDFIELAPDVFSATMHSVLPEHSHGLPETLEFLVGIVPQGLYAFPQTNNLTTRTFGPSLPSTPVNIVHSTNQIFSYEDLIVQFNGINTGNETCNGDPAQIEPKYWALTFIMKISQ